MHGRGHAWLGMCVWQGACMVGAYIAGGMCSREGVWQGGMHGRGHVWQGACMAGEHAWQGSMCGRGQGDIPPSRYYKIRSMSRQYASYWNAFLFVDESNFIICSQNEYHTGGIHIKLHR